MFHMTTSEIVDTITNPMIDDPRDVFLSAAIIIETISARVGTHLDRAATAEEATAIHGLLDQASRDLRFLGEGGNPLPSGALDPRIAAIECVTSRVYTTEFAFYEMYEITEALGVGLRRSLDKFVERWTSEERRAVGDMLEHAAMRFIAFAESS